MDVIHYRKKVEIWHNVLRAARQAHNTAEEICKEAIIIAMSKSRKSFIAEFAKPYCRGMSEKTWEGLVGKTAETLLAVIETEGQNIGKLKLVNGRC